MPIALDAMGGDHAPAVTVAGAIRAADRLSVRVLLVGDRTALEAELGRSPRPPRGLEIVPADSVIQMDENPGPALLRKRTSSIVVATDLVKDGRACAVVSAGNSGAAMGAATLRLGLLPGVDRPAIAMLLPSQRGPVIILDVGATVDCRPENLRDFARMGSVYAQCVLHVDRPRVGLLSIGEEPSKGNALTKQAHPVLKEEPINFIGNVEGRHVAEGNVDVVVCDGFVGNAILKSIEGYAELIWSLLRERLATSWRSRLGAWMLRPALRRLAEEFDYASYGGALLLGVNGICIIGHGRSTPAAVENAIRVAKELADQRVLEQLAASAERVGGQPPRAAAGRKSDSQR